jgi:hypothetical protein
MREMVTGAEQITQTVLRVNEVSGENENTIGDLSQEVSKFKIA